MPIILEPPTNAGDAGVRTLFRYFPYPPLADQSADAIERRRRVEALITSGELYLPCAGELNDPFEAAPHFAVPRTGDGAVDVEELLRILREVYAPRWGWTEAKIAESEAALREKVGTGVFEVELLQLQAKWRTAYQTQFPMICLSSTDQSVLLWAYYAGGHTGVCVHFDATVAPFGNSFKVRYEENYPVLPVPSGEIAPGLIIQQCLLIKAKAWEHEHEFRFINVPVYAPNSDQITGHVLDGLVRSDGPKRVRVPPRYVVGLTCGAKMEGNEIEHLIGLCAERSPKLTLQKAQVHKSEYRLKLEPVRG